METVIVEQIKKVYGKEKMVAVDDVSFAVNKGEIFGLIGPDGAGKSSIFRMLTTLLLPDGGKATVDGFDIIQQYKEIRQRIGYMPGKFSLYQDLTIEENLNFFATVFGTTVEENYHLIKEIYVQIEPFKKRRAGKLSGGMKQKLALCCALIHKPTVLFLDEPTTGVDPVSRKEFWEMLGRLKEQGITILVSTPYMDEATLCDRIGLIQKGKLLSINTPSNIIADYPDELFAIKADNMYSLLHTLQAYDKIDNSYAFGEYAHVALAKNGINPDDVISYVKSKGITGVEWKKADVTIEDCFINRLKE